MSKNNFYLLKQNSKNRWSLYSCCADEVTNYPDTIRRFGGILVKKIVGDYEKAYKVATEVEHEDYAEYGIKVEFIKNKNEAVVKE